MKFWLITLLLCLAFGCSKKDSPKIYMHNENDLKSDSTLDSVTSATTLIEDISSDTEIRSIIPKDNKSDNEIMDESAEKTDDISPKTPDNITKTTLRSNKSSVSTTIDPLEQELLDMQDDIKDQVETKKSLNPTNINKANSAFDGL